MIAMTQIGIMQNIFTSCDFKFRKNCVLDIFHIFIVIINADMTHQEHSNSKHVSELGSNSKKPIKGMSETFRAMFAMVWGYKQLVTHKHFDDTVHTLRYGTRRRQVMDVYLPQQFFHNNNQGETGDTVPKNKCFILGIGAGWILGRKLFGTPFAYAGQKLGYVTFVLDYPRYPFANVDEQINDVTNALSYIMDDKMINNLNIDKNHVNIACYSAAGHIVMHSFLKRLKDIANDKNGKTDNNNDDIKKNNKFSWKPNDFNSFFVCSCPCSLKQVFESHYQHFAFRNTLNSIFDIKSSSKNDKNNTNIISKITNTKAKLFDYLNNEIFNFNYWNKNKHIFDWNSNIALKFFSVINSINKKSHSFSNHTNDITTTSTTNKNKNNIDYLERNTRIVDINKNKKKQSYYEICDDETVDKYCISKQMENMIKEKRINCHDLCSMYVINGDCDTTCHFESAQQFHNILKSNGFNSKLYSINGWEHLDYAYQDPEPLITKIHSLATGSQYCWNDFVLVD